MTTRILTEAAASISELKANPMKVALSAHGEPIAVFYLLHFAFCFRVLKNAAHL
jgi:hypothetical protein